MDARARDHEPFRAGIVGAGLMGRWHAEAVARAGGAVVAVTDLDAAAAQRLAARHAGAAPYETLEAMLAQAGLDVLHVCTPLATHEAVVLQGISAGVQLLVEKPLAPSAGQARRLYEQAQARGVLLCPVLQFNFQDGVRRARAWWPHLGRVIHMEATVRSAGGVGQSEAQRDAVLADVLPHPLSLIETFLPGGLSGGFSGGADWYAAHPAPGELHAVGHAAGCGLSIRISMNGRPTACAFQIVGTEGTIDLNLFHGYAVFHPGAVSRARKITAPFGQALRGLAAASLNLSRRAVRREPAYPGLRPLVRAFYQAIRMGGPAPLPPDLVLTVAAVRDRLIEQAQLLRHA